MDIIEVIAIVAIGALFARYIGFLKGVPVKKTTALILAIGIGVVGAYNYNWGGFKDLLAGVELAPEPTVTAGVTFEADGSESDANLVFDQNTGVFTCSYVENASDLIVNSTDNDFYSVTFTLTVYRTDMLALAENAVSKVWATVPTFYGKNENASILYWPIEKDNITRKYAISFLPTGGSTRDEYNYFTVGSGGAKTITVVADIRHVALAQLDNFQSKDIQIHIHGLNQTFTLRFVKIGDKT